MGLKFGMAAAALGLAAVTLPGAAQAKPAICEIVTPDGGYRGPCDFAARRGGSFELTFPGGPPEPHSIDSLSLTITKPGRGRVIGMYTEGGEDWGTFVRNPQKPACWVNAARKSRVCVY